MTDESTQQKSSLPVLIAYLDAKISLAAVLSTESVSLDAPRAREISEELWRLWKLEH